ncbi:hypothetical protein D3C81_2004700 [compost metagenome]
MGLIGNQKPGEMLPGGDVGASLLAKAPEPGIRQQAGSYRRNGMSAGVDQARAFSTAWISAGSSGAVRGEKRASTRPSLPTRNFSKFQVMSPGNSAPSPASRRYSG